MKRVIVAPGLFKDFGESRKTIDTFAKALNSTIYSFFDGICIRSEFLAMDNLVLIPSSTIPTFRQFLVSQEKSGDTL